MDENSALAVVDNGNVRSKWCGNQGADTGMDKKQRTTRRAFTLIELLVVIAVVALLLSILVPALRHAKELAKTAYCQNNLRTLTIALSTYTMEHDQNLPGSWNYNGQGWGSPWDWAWAPWEVNGSAVVDYANSTDEQEHEGIRRGTLWSYIQAVESYHCPSDRSAAKNFRSYSMPDCLNGLWGEEQTQVANWHNYTKTTDVRSPGDKYAFLEECDPRGYNINAWVLHTDGKDAVGWGDPLTVWHFKKSSVGFLDGHAETWKWSDEITAVFLDLDVDQWSFWGYVPTTDEGKQDLERLKRGWNW